jgi:hypothetical protein
MQESQHLPISCEVLLLKSRNFKAYVKENTYSLLVFPGYLNVNSDNFECDPSKCL